MTATHHEFRARVDHYLDSCIKDFYHNIPYGRHLLEENDINLGYYKRHTIETILRLRRKRTIDALAIRYFTKCDPVTAKAWARYTAEEMLHDALFAADLAKVGVSREQIYATEPMLATMLLTGYLQYGIEYEGTPLSLIASVYFVEYTTTRTQPDWITNMERSLGPDRVAGARAHVGTDLDDAHDDLVWEVLVTMVKTPEDEVKVLRHLQHIYRLWQLYFVELYQLTVNPDYPLQLPAPIETGAP